MRQGRGTWNIFQAYHRIHLNFAFKILHEYCDYHANRDRRGCDRMVVGFTTTYAMIVYHH